MIKNQIHGYNGNNWHWVRIDRSTRSLQTIDYAHHELHGGSLFSASGAADVAGAGTLILTFKTPDTALFELVP
jgi:hypothetical protein